MSKEIMYQVSQCIIKNNRILRRCFIEHYSQQLNIRDGIFHRIYNLVYDDIVDTNILLKEFKYGIKL